jgi:hypothetical protein
VWWVWVWCPFFFFFLRSFFPHGDY